MGAYTTKKARISDRPGRFDSAVLAAAACIGGTSAWAQAGGGLPTLPATIVDTRVGDLRGQLQQYLPGLLPRDTGPAFLVTTSLGVDMGITDNALHADRPRRTDLFTEFSPSIQVSGDTARLKVNLSYAPVASVYARTSSQTRLDQFGNAVALATIVPDAVFLDVRGSITQQSRTGGYGRTSSQTLNRDDQIQSTALSVTPYAEHRFRGWGTGRIGYSLARTIENGRSNQNALDASQALQLNGTGFGATGNLTTQRERASFVTGENLGRVNNAVAVEAVQYSGGDLSYRGAHRNQITNDVGYAVTRTITALVGFGYQDLRFGGAPGVRINEPIWSVGGRITPDPDSTITVSYGHRDGFNAAVVDGAYSPTARTRVFVRYSTGLTTDAEEQQNLLQSTNVGPTGLLVDSVTGAPVTSSSGAFGTQNGLYRLRRFSITGLFVLPRDALSVGLAQDDRTSVSATTASAGVAAAPAGSSNSGIIGTVSWQHELTPALTSSASISYGLESNGSVGGAASQGSPRTIQTSVALNYIFTQTLTGNVRYSFVDRSGGSAQTTQFNSSPFGYGQAGQNLTENLLLAGLRKSF